MYIGDEILPSYIYIYTYIFAYIYTHIDRDYMELLKKHLTRIPINQPVFNGKYGRFFCWLIWIQLDALGRIWVTLVLTIWASRLVGLLDVNEWEGDMPLNIAIPGNGVCKMVTSNLLYIYINTLYVFSIYHIQYDFVRKTSLWGAFWSMQRKTFTQVTILLGGCKHHCQVREISLGLAMTRQGPHAPSLLIIKASVDGLLREAFQLAYAYEFLKWKWNNYYTKWFRIPISRKLWMASESI